MFINTAVSAGDLLDCFADHEGDPYGIWARTDDHRTNAVVVAEPERRRLYVSLSPIKAILILDLRTPGSGDTAGDYQGLDRRGRGQAP